MPNKFPSLAELARNNPDQYRNMPVEERLAMVQAPYFADKASMSPEDLGLFQLLSARHRRETARDTAPQQPLAPPDSGPSFLGSLFQFFSGRQAVDPLEDLKRPGYAGRPSR